jgi:hypothetical protein
MTQPEQRRVLHSRHGCLLGLFWVPAADPYGYPVWTERSETGHYRTVTRHCARIPRQAELRHIASHMQFNARATRDLEVAATLFRS